MEARKLIKFGNSSFVMSIPPDWIAHNNLKKGEQVFVERDGSSLKINARKDTPPEKIRKIVIETAGKHLAYIRTEIVSAYLTNHNIIDVRGQNLKTIAPSIKQIIRNLVGLEIMALTADRIIAKDLLDARAVSIRNIIRRIDMSVRSMLTDSFASKISEYCESINERDKDVNRLVFLAYRILRKALKEPPYAQHIGLEPIAILVNWEIVMRLEKIGDQSKRIARCLNSGKAGSRTALYKLHKTLESDYLDVMKAYYTDDKEVAYQIEVSQSSRIALCDSYLKMHAGVNDIQIILNLKGTNSSIRHIARSVIAKEEPSKG
ncbi:MAG: phosphate uptake regulator PhoU [archaeon]